MNYLQQHCLWGPNRRATFLSLLFSTSISFAASSFCDSKAVHHRLDLFLHVGPVIDPLRLNEPRHRFLVPCSRSRIRVQGRASIYHRKTRTTPHTKAMSSSMKNSIRLAFLALLLFVVVFVARFLSGQTYPLASKCFHDGRIAGSQKSSAKTVFHESSLQGIIPRKFERWSFGHDALCQHGKISQSLDGLLFLKPAKTAPAPRLG